MSIYLTNYWTLYQEFVETFNQLKFRNIPIVLLTNFYQQIDEELKNKMENKNFQSHLSVPEMEQKMIQPFFEKWLGKIRVPLLPKSENGKTLIHSDYTRIPEQTYTKWFDPNHTIILTRSKKTHMYGIPSETLGNYEETDSNASDELIKKAKSIFKKVKNNPAFGNEFFQQTFLNRIPLIVKSIGTVCNLISKLNISSIVVGTTEDMLSRALSIIGSLRGIKSICLQHGILMGEEAFMPVFTTIAGVYGEYEKNWYKKRGVTLDRIAEIGHPKFDEIYINTETNNQKEFLEKIGLDPAKRTLLVITGPNLDFNKFEKLMKNISDHASFQLLIKPHPWEMGKGKYERYMDFEKIYPSIKVYTLRENNLYELLSHVDGVVSSLSTVVLEGILLNKPVFIYNFLTSNRRYDYFDTLGEFIQSDPDILVNILINYYKYSAVQERYREYMDQYLLDSYNDGCSAKKLLECINHDDANY